VKVILGRPPLGIEHIAAFDGNEQLANEKRANES